LPLVAQLWLAGQSLMASLVWVSTSVMQFFWYLMRLQTVWSIFSSAQKFEPGEGMQKIYECPYASSLKLSLLWSRSARHLCSLASCQ
jgi:hypothetical protein